MKSLQTLKNIFAPISKVGLASSLLFSLLLSLFSTPPAEAVDRRIIDVVSISWNRSPALTGTVTQAASQIEEKVKPLWRELTTVYGDPSDRRIEFTLGQVLTEPIRLTYAIPCDSNFLTLTSSVRLEAYKRLGITDWQSRYLVILTPDAGCIWSGRAMLGEVNKPGGSLVLHNSIDGFVIAHELGHAFGLGHSNLLRCSDGAADGSWSNCRAVEYGGSIDLMGNVDVSTPLSTYHQWRMGLLTSSEVKQSWRSESIEINSIQDYGKPRAIFLRDGKSTYWIEYRKASGLNKAGLVIYRTDPPPSSSIQSPNPADLFRDLTEEVGTDIWMLNLDNFTYSNSKSSGSMALEAGKSATVYTGNISLTAISAGANSIMVNIVRKDSSDLKKPLLSLSASWRSPDAPILDASYTESVNDLADFEARINGVAQLLDTSAITDWKPTYLNPFTAPKLLQLKDLPEGQYSLSLRVRNLSGLWSPWSDIREVKIDRALPVITSDYAIARVQSNRVLVELTGVEDRGSGLCATELVNAEGWIIERSNLKSKPQLTIQIGEAKSGRLQVFDCLGNGRSASLTGSATIAPANSLRLTGKWSAASAEFPEGSMKCASKCVAYLATTGVAGIILGSGSAEFSLLGSGAKKNVKASGSGDSYAAASILVGPRKKSLKISGGNFVLIGIASATFSITNIGNATAFAADADHSLDDPLQKTLNKYGFSALDFSSEWSIAPMGRGTTLEDPTLDLCSANFPSELERKERRQVLANKRGNPYLFLSTESVRYKSISAAKQALSEIKLSYSNCVKNKGGVERDGAFTPYQFLELPNLPINLLPPTQSVIVYAKIGEGESARYLFGAYQYQGELFTGLYVISPGSREFTRDEITRWLEVASVMAERLKA